MCPIHQVLIKYIRYIETSLVYSLEVVRAARWVCDTYPAREIQYLR